MRRFLLSTAVMLYLSVPAAIAAARYGEWLLEQPRSSVLTLTFKQSASLDNKVATSELGFVCDQGDKSGIVGAVLIPFDGTFALVCRTHDFCRNRKPHDDVVAAKAFSVDLSRTNFSCRAFDDYQASHRAGWEVLGEHRRGEQTKIRSTKRLSTI